ncbi:MAG TPA: hypothetical protein VFI90_05590 [Rubrobacter sp.]|nr:hypothetical protein [Rubrobacter sp.]
MLKGLVISRYEHGVGIENDAANDRVQGNFIGTDPSGTKALGPLTHNGFANGVVIGNRSGITNHIVGGHTPAARNLTSGNNDGVGVNSDGNQVSGNLIGTQRDGKCPLGNIHSGVHIRGGSNNVVGGATPGYANTIAFSGNYGVRVEPYIGLARVGNSIISNSIFSNAALGIELGGDGVASLNDAGDADTGDNNLQNNPILYSVKKTATGTTIVKGKLGSNPNQTFFIQFFSNPKGTNEGRNLLGSKTVATDGSCNVSFTFSTKKPIKPGQNMATTATNSATGDTSEFSAPSKIAKF